MDYNISKIGLFASFARNEQDENSGIDILVEVYPGIEKYKCLNTKENALKDDARWNSSFSKTQTKLAAAARQVRREIKEGKSTPFISDDEYLRSIDGMVESIKEARKEPDQYGVSLDKLDW